MPPVGIVWPPVHNGAHPVSPAGLDAILTRFGSGAIRMHTPPALFIDWIAGKLFRYPGK